MPLWKMHRRPKHVITPEGGLQRAGETVLASAALISKEQVRSVVGRRADWQADAWNLYDAVTELRFGVSWIANACSRARLYVGVIDPDGSSQPIPIDIADDTEENAMLVAPLTELGGGQLGQSEMLRRLSIHLNIPGESYLVGFDDPDNGERTWLVCSPDEISTSGTAIKVRSPSLPDHYHTIDPANSTVLRIWRPHPRFAYFADSPLMSLRQPLRELVDLSAHITASAESRLAGAGILFIPDEITIPTPAQSDGVNPLHADPFTASLIEAMAAPLKNRDSASAVVPMVVRGPAVAGKEIKHLTFSTEFDSNAQSLRESAIRRVATGMDIPPEVLTGLGGTNHWCVTPDTEIMTRTGWKKHHQLTVGEPVLTLDHTTGLSEWQPLEAVNTWDVTDEPMVRIKGRHHHSYTTDAHRWPVLSITADAEPDPGAVDPCPLTPQATADAQARGRAWTTSAALETILGNPRRDWRADPQQYLIHAVPCTDLPVTAKHSDALVEIVAWYYAAQEPDHTHAPRVVLTAQPTHTPDHCARIERALTYLYGPATPTFSGGNYTTDAVKQRRAEARRLRAENPGRTLTRIAGQVGVSTTTVATYLKESIDVDRVPHWRARTETTTAGTTTRYELNAAASDTVLAHMTGRTVAPEFVHALTAAQLELFLDVCTRSHGTLFHGGTAPTNTPAFTRSRRADTEAFELAAILSGRAVATTTAAAHPTTDTADAHTTCRVTGRTTFPVMPPHVTRDQYTGTIWCPTTANGTWLARHQGTVYYTGNSAWQIEESAIKLHIEPLLGLICDSLTTHFFQPALKSLGVEGWPNYAIWYDTTDLTLRPNRAPEAENAYNRSVISEDAYRRELGFSDEDAPDSTERRRNILTQIALSNPQLAPYALRALGIELPGLSQSVGLPTVVDPDQVTNAVRKALPNVRSADQPGADDGPLPDDATATTPDTEDRPAERTSPATAGPGASSRVSGSPGGRTPRPGGLSAEAAQAWRTRCLDMAVIRALERAGQYMIRATPRRERVELQRMQLHAVHVDLAADPDRLDEMLSGAYKEFHRATPGEDCLHAAVDRYVRALLLAREPHRTEYLDRAVHQFGCDQPTPQEAFDQDLAAELARLEQQRLVEEARR